jgi:hypothetical protein
MIRALPPVNKTVWFSGCFFLAGMIRVDVVSLSVIWNKNTQLYERRGVDEACCRALT